MTLLKDECSFHCIRSHILLAHYSHKNKNKTPFHSLLAQAFGREQKINYKRDKEITR